jgi:ATP-dependent RNA helicase RhlE
MTFSELGLAEPLLRAVSKEGYAEPTPIQAQTIPALLAGRDVLGSAPTGTGKTAAFSLPILQHLQGKPRAASGPRRIRTLILSPTRELAAQIGDAIRTYGHFTSLRYTVVFGGVGYFPQIQALRRGVDISVATPGRLLDLINQRYVDLSGVEIFVLDEADRMLDMGFIPDIRRIVELLPNQRQSMLFSATMPGVIEQLARTMLKNPAQVAIAAAKAEIGLIEESVCFVPQNQKAKLLTTILHGQAVGRVIVFTRTKHGADRVTNHLAKSGIRAEALHGNKTQSARLRTMANFRADRTQVVVATDLAARGIDVDGISHVLNYDLPHEPETYVHRIGRTGRAGAKGVAVSFCDVEERKHLRSIERMLRRALRVERTAFSVSDEEPRGEVNHQSGNNKRSDNNRPRTSVEQSSRQESFRHRQGSRQQRQKRQGGKIGKKRREVLVSSPDQWRR